MSHAGEVQEAYRRLHAAIESHPHLSGLMTDEHHRYLRMVAESGWRMAEHRYGFPRCLEPNYELDLGIDEIQSEREIAAAARSLNPNEGG